jgi:uncharacterized protein YigE (DUF2233 family)
MIRGIIQVFTTGLRHRSWRGGVRVGLLVLVGIAPVIHADLRAELRTRKVGPGIDYFNQAIPEAPWSINVVTVDRQQADLDFTATLAGGAVQGLEILSEQLKAIPRNLGIPVVAVNGDFYQTEHERCPGDPRGLEILRGELISAPNGSASFWIGYDGKPQMTGVASRFRATWPTGDSIPLGLNEDRGDAEAVLYTPRFGGATRTSGGRELLLESETAGAAPSLQAGQVYTLRIRQSREGGNSRIPPGTVILSIGPDLQNRIPDAQPGARIKISTTTIPDLKGAKTALSGGPILIQDGKVQRVTSNKAGERHPRTAFGWNDRQYFFVQVDGRQSGFSVGMTLRELAQYMAKLGCEQAMNFDGGGSSTLWLSGRVMNRPCYGYERPIANGLAVIRKEKPNPASE